MSLDNRVSFLIKDITGEKILYKAVNKLAKDIETSTSNVNGWIYNTGKIPLCQCVKIKNYYGTSLKSLRPDLIHEED